MPHVAPDTRLVGKSYDNLSHYNFDDNGSDEMSQTWTKRFVSCFERMEFEFAGVEGVLQLVQ